MLILFLFIPLLLSACNDDSSKNESTNPEEKAVSNTEKNDIPTNKYNYSDFGVVKKAKDIGSYKSGPISITVPEAHLVSGTFADEYFVEEFGEEAVDYIQLAMVISTKDEDIIFDSQHLKLTTETGGKN